MTALLFLLLLVPDQRADLRAIEELHKRDVAATKAYDVDALTLLWTDDIVTMPPSAQPVQGKKANRDLLIAGQERAKQVDIVEYNQKWEEITVTGEFAYEWGTFNSIIKAKSNGQTANAQFKVMRVLKRQPDGTWRVHRSMWNEIPPPSPSTPPPAKP